MPNPSESTRAPFLAGASGRLLRHLTDQIEALLPAANEHPLRPGQQQVYLVIAGLIIVLVLITLLLALLHWIRNLLAALLVVLIAAVLQRGRHRGHELGSLQVEIRHELDREHESLEVDIRQGKRVDDDGDGSGQEYGLWDDGVLD